MATEDPTPRSRRAILAAAAGAAGAIAASAALPLTAAAADPNDVVKGVDNPTTTTTTITNSGGSTAFAAASSNNTGAGYGVLGTSTGAGGVVAWSAAPPDTSWFGPELTAYTGVFGYAPSHPDSTMAATGVWGDSPDFGVAGTGWTGVYGAGGIGVYGEAENFAGNIAVWAWAPTVSQTALKVTGKVSFSRSGRKAMRSGTKTKTVYLSGTTSTSKVFAVLATSEAGRWVRAVVPGSGKFTIYLNTTLTSGAVVSWFVLD